MFKIKNIAASAAFLLAIAISANAFADGCNPGEPCYQKPTAPVQKQAVEQAPVRLDQEPMAEEVVVEEESVVDSNHVQRSGLADATKTKAVGFWNRVADRVDQSRSGVAGTGRRFV